MKIANAVIRLGDEVPDFTAETTRGVIRFHEWKRDSWALLFSHPGDFTPVCTTELAAVAALTAEFEKRNTKVMALSVDPLHAHYRWLSDIKEVAGTEVTFPIVADSNRWIASLCGMLHSTGGVKDAVRMAYLVDPENRVQLIHAYPDSVGRNFEEVLRVLDALQRVAQHGVATPAGWRPGQDVLIPVHVTDEDAQARFPRGFKASKHYLRVTPDPER